MDSILHKVEEHERGAYCVCHGLWGVLGLGLNDCYVVV